LKPDTNVFRAWLIVVGIWVSIILNVAINVGINGASHFYGPNEACEFFFLINKVKLTFSSGCWIVDEFHVQRTVADYMWMWIAAFSSLMAYVATFLVLGRFISVKGWHVRWTYGQESSDIPPTDNIPYRTLP